MTQHLLCSDGLTDGEIPGDEKSEDTVMNEILKPYGVKGDGSDAEEVGNDAEEVMGNSEVADESNKAEELDEWLLLLEERAVTIAVQPVQPLRLRILGKVPDESNIEKEFEEWLQLMDEEVTAPVRIRIAENICISLRGKPTRSSVTRSRSRAARSTLVAARTGPLRARSVMQARRSSTPMRKTRWVPVAAR